jgi:tetratricopeptide (TPR) repeat protein
MKNARKRRSRRLWISLVSLSIGLIMQPASVQAQTGQARPAPVSRGYSLLERGWVNDAIAAFQEALRRYPQSLEAKSGLAIAYQRAGQDANAWQAYQRVLAQDPNNRQALSALGVLSSYRAEWQSQGIAALTTLLNLAPDDRAARAQRGLLLGYQGRYAEALADYEIALSGNPTPEVILGAAQTYTYSGDYAEGLALFNRYQAGRTIPNSAVTAYALALRETGNPGAAVEILESRLQRSGQDATAIEMRTALAIAYQANQQSAAALAILEPLYGNAAARLPLARALSTIARATRDVDRYQEAVTLYQQVLAQSTPATALLIEAADVFSELPAAQAEALRLYEQVLAQQPDNSSLRVKQLALASQLGQVSQAELRQQLLSVLQPLPASAAAQRSIAQALLPLDPPDPALLPVYQVLRETEPFLNFRIAQMLLQTGDYASARQAIAAYRATAPVGLAPELLLLAEIDRREGNLEASAQRYETLIAGNPADPLLEDALRGLAGVRLAQGQSAAALAAYDQLLARNPTDARAQLGRTSLAFQSGQISARAATSTLDQWLQANSIANAPPELFDLVGKLPADPQRESLYNQLLAIEPDYLEVNRRLVQVLAARDPAAAQTVVNQFLGRNPNDINGYWLQGELAMMLGDLRFAGRSYEEILERQPENADALLALAGVRFEQQQYAAARELYNRVLALKPNDFETRRILAELSLAQDQPLTALRELQQLQQETPVPNPAIDRRIDQTRIDLLRRRGFQPSWEQY